MCLEVSHTVLYETITDRLKFRKLVRPFSTKNANRSTQNKPSSFRKWLPRPLWRRRWKFYWLYCNKGLNMDCSLQTWEQKTINAMTAFWSPVAKNWKHSKVKKEIIATVFWNRKEILLIDFLPRGESINADWYYETLQRLCRAIKNKRKGG